MRNAVDDKTYTVEEYIQFKWKAEQRHEYINGKLFKNWFARKYTSYNDVVKLEKFQTEFLLKDVYAV